MNAFFTFLFLLLAIVTLAPLLGRYMAFIFQGQKIANSPLRGLAAIERFVFRLSSLEASQEMSVKTYTLALLCFNFWGLLALFVLQLLQGLLPLNPQGFAGVDPLLAFNTAVSFVTNTNWQAYGGENSMSYLTQMSGLAVQNFLSAATGNAVLLVFIRSVKGEGASVGNFWKDTVRFIVFLLLPLSTLLALFLVSQGVIQNFNAYLSLETLEGAVQTLPMGPVASQEAIKLIGSNGGGFFNANSAHPFENPTALSNFVGTLALLALPAASVFMYGYMTEAKKEALVIFAVMLFLWMGGVALASYFQHVANPLMPVHPVLEGVETRFGVEESLFWAVSTTATSNGSVNSMHSSLAPLVGGIALFNMMLGEIVFGGVGVGLCGMLMFVLLTVFLSGLMVGRTPEYLNKKIEKSEVQWMMLAILAPSSIILLGSSFAILFPQALESLSSSGPHGFSELLYTFSSTAANNGSAFAGFKADTPFYNLLLGCIMLVTRATLLIPTLAIAGNLAQKKKSLSSLGSFKTDNLLFAFLLLGVILVVAALTFFPALSLGPILEQLLMKREIAF